MRDPATEHLSRRERQAMDVLYRAGRATAQEVMEAMPDPPNYSAVRSLLAVLEEKGLARHRREAKKYVYEPAVSPVRARRGALRRLLATFFDGSPERLVASLLDPAERRLTSDEAARIRALLDEHEKRRRRAPRTR
jgi:predicted transcriptional regulator